MKKFSQAWAFSGTTNLRHSNAEDHAKGEPHMRAMELHLKNSGVNIHKRAELMKTNSKQ